MSLALPDLNLLVAAAWPHHVHHLTARRWFAGNADHGWATCPLTQTGFIRLSSNPRIIEDAVSPEESRALLERITQYGRHEFWPDSLSWTEEWKLPFARITGHRQVTDAYLLSLALSHDGRLVTFDRAISNLLPPESPLRDAVVTLTADE